MAYPLSAVKKDSRQVAALRERVREQGNEVSAAEKCCERQEPLVQALQRQLDDAHTAVVGFEIDCVNAENRCKQSTEEIAELRAACSEWPRRLGSAIAEERRLQQVSRDQTARAKSLEADIAELEELLALEEAGQAELDSLRQQLSEAKTVQDELRSEDTIKTSIADRRMAIQELDRRLAERDRARQQEQEEKEAAEEAELRQLEAKQRSLEAYYTSLQQYQKNLEEELAASDRQRQTHATDNGNHAVPASLGSSKEQSKALDFETEQLQALSNQLRSLRAALSDAGQATHTAQVADKFGTTLTPLLLRLGAPTPQERTKAAFEVGTALREIQMAMQEVSRNDASSSPNLVTPPWTGRET